WLTYLTDAEVARGAGWTDLIAELAAQRRVTHIVGAGAGVWVTAERLPLFAALFPAARPEPAVTTPAGRAQSVSSEAALVEAARRDRAHRGARLRALPPRLAARHAQRSHGGSRCGGRGARAARGLRGAGQRLGDRDPAQPHRRVRARLARWTVPRRSFPVDVAQRPPQRPGARRSAGARHAVRAARAA